MSFTIKGFINIQQAKKIHSFALIRIFLCSSGEDDKQNTYFMGMNWSMPFCCLMYLIQIRNSVWWVGVFPSLGERLGYTHPVLFLFLFIFLANVESADILPTAQLNLTVTLDKHDRNVSPLPVQLYFKGDNMVDILQHISHCGIRGIRYTRQRHWVPLAHLDQT